MRVYRPIFAEVALILIFLRVAGFESRLLIALIHTPHICYLGSKKTATYLPEVASEQGWDKAGRANHVAQDRRQKFTELFIFIEI
jgi:hypothetical protein